MSTATSIWQRVGSVFRTPDQPLNGEGAALHIEPVRASANPGPDAAEPRSLFPWRRRTRDELQRREHVAKLMDTLAAHFEQQDQRSAEMTAAIRDLGQILQQLATTQGTQAQHVASIAEHADRLARRSGALETILGELPASVQAQAEAVRAVANELGASRAAGDRLRGALDRFGEAAEAWQRCGTEQTEAVGRMHETTTRQADTLQQFVAQQSRRLLTITVALGVVALAALAGLGTALFLILR